MKTNVIPPFPGISVIFPEILGISAEIELWYQQKEFVSGN